MTDNERRALAEVLAADDAWRAEHEAWLARREAVETAPVQKSGAGGLMYQTREQNEWAGTPVADAHVFTGVLSEAQHDLLARTLGKIITELRREWQGNYEAALVERDRRISLFENELREVKAMLGTALARFGDAARTREQEHDELRHRLDTHDARNKFIAEHSGRVAELQRENAVARREAEKQQLNSALAEYHARIGQIETKLAMLVNFIGPALPRGFGREME